MKNELFAIPFSSSRPQRKLITYYLNLVFNAISLTQMYGFLAYLDTNERAAFLSWDKVRSDSYVGNVMPYYNSGQLSLLLELEKHQK